MARFQVLEREQYRENVVGGSSQWRFSFSVLGPAGEHSCRLRIVMFDGGVVDGPDEVLLLDPVELAKFDLFANLSSAPAGEYTAKLVIAGEEIDSFTFTIN